MKHRHCLKTGATTKEKKSIIPPIMICCALVGTPMAALAKTVYYKGTAVYWNYGRNAEVFGFSDCNSQNYEHCSSCNGYSSGWEQPGTLSKAWGWIGTATLEAYWNCRG